MTIPPTWAFHPSFRPLNHIKPSPTDQVTFPTMDEKACSRFSNASDFVNISIKTYRSFSHLVTPWSSHFFHSPGMSHVETQRCRVCSHRSPFLCRSKASKSSRFCYGGWCTENGWWIEHETLKMVSWCWLVKHLSIHVFLDVRTLNTGISWCRTNRAWVGRIQSRSLVPTTVRQNMGKTPQRPWTLMKIQL